MIHTPGPVWHGGTHHEAEKLFACYFNSLTRAAEKQCRVIAFPCISTGVYHFPPEKAAEIALKTVLNWTGAFPEEVIFCCFSERDRKIYEQLLS